MEGMEPGVAPPRRSELVGGQRWAWVAIFLGLQQGVRGI
jgi:hypothetical protein